MNWQDTLIDLIELELRDCPKEKACYLNNILSFIGKRLKEEHFKGFTEGADLTGRIAETEMAEYKETLRTQLQYTTSDKDTLERINNILNI